MSVILGFLIMGVVFGLFPLIVSIIKKRFTFGWIIFGACVILSMINIGISFVVAVVCSIILLFLRKE